MPFAFAIHSFSVWSPPDCDLGCNTLRFEPPFDSSGQLLQPAIQPNSPSRSIQVLCAHDRNSLFDETGGVAVLRDVDAVFRRIGCG
jgi:hypothetical protein